MKVDFGNLNSYNPNTSVIRANFDSNYHHHKLYNIHVHQNYKINFIGSYFFFFGFQSELLTILLLSLIHI